MKIHPHRESKAPVDEREFGVILTDGTEQRYETVKAWSRERAADMCQKRCGLAWQPVAVTVTDRFEVAGRCVVCPKWLLLPGDEPVETPHGYRCRDC